MRFRQFFENVDFALQGQVPPEPGTIQVPPGHVRLYHYTGVDGPSDEARFQAAQNLRQNGLDIGKAKGSTYGEPNVVWASTAMPNPGKVFAEFSIAMNAPRWAQGKPNPNESPQEYESKKWDCYFYDSIRPEEILAVHEPWHSKYRYLMQNPRVKQEVAAGEHDDLMDRPEYGPAVRRAKLELTGQL